MIKILPLTLSIRRPAQAVLLLMTASVAMTLACSLIAPDSTNPPAPTAQPSAQQPATPRQPTATPTAVPVIPAPPSTSRDQQTQEQPTPAPTAVGPVPIVNSFDSAAIRFDYGNEWRLSGKTDDSVTFTLKESPGGAMLSVQWMDDVDSSLDQFASQFEEKLRLYAQEVEVLEDTTIGGTDARRFGSLVQDGDNRSVAMNVIFQSGQRFYLATFAASPEDFGKHARAAMDLIEGFTLP